MRLLTLTLALLVVAGCFETDRARERFCENNPEKCGGSDSGSGGGPGGGGGGGAGGGSGGGVGGGAGGGGGGVDAGEPCDAAGLQRNCYTGAPGTLDAGLCHGGTATCQLTLVWGPCVNEVTPATETCANTTDEDCDNVVGNGCVCVPGNPMSCSNLDGGNPGIGACKLGTQTCGATGDGYGACSGEIAPSEEVCFSNNDENCDGASACTGEPLLVPKVFAETGNPLKIVALVPDGSGGLYVVAEITANATLNGNVYSPVGGSDVLVIHFSNTLAFDWVRMWGGTGTQAPTDAALAPSGNLLVSGSFGSPTTSQTFAFDAGTLPSKSSLLQDGFLLEIDSQGTPTRFTTIAEDAGAGTSNQAAVAVAVNPSSNFAYVAAESAGSPIMSALTTTSAQGTDAFVFRVDLATGSADRWARVTSPGYEKVTGLGVSSNGRVALFGDSSATLSPAQTIGTTSNGVAGNGIAAAGNGDAYLATFDAQLNGATIGLQANTQPQVAGPMKFASGKSELTVAFQNGAASTLAGTGMCPSLTTSTSAATVLARFDDTGTCLWRRLIDGVNVTGLSGDQPVLVGQVFGTARFDPPNASATAVGTADGFIALYGSDGGYRGHNLVGGSGSDAIPTVVMGASGGYAVGLNTASQYTYLGVALNGGQTGGNYHFLIRLAP